MQLGEEVANLLVLRGALASRDLHPSKKIGYQVSLGGTLNTGVGEYWVWVYTHTQTIFSGYLGMGMGVIVHVGIQYHGS